MQNYEIKSLAIQKKFEAYKSQNPDKLKTRLKRSWSTWMFGREPLELSAKRLHDNGLSWIELKADRQTPDSGVSLQCVRRILDRYELKVSGACGLFSPENDLASNNAFTIQRAKDYIKRELEFLYEVGATYFIIVPSAVGRTEPIDAWDMERSVETLRSLAGYFDAAGVKAAIEPIRSAEVSLIHSIDEVKDYIKRVNHPAIACINADTYHMLTEEEHIGQSILNCASALINLHVADSNRSAPGSGMIDFVTVIRALYLMGYNNRQAFVTCEPLGPVLNPYARVNAFYNAETMDELVRRSMETLCRIEDTLVNE